MNFAAITMVWNQPHFLSIWAGYYAQQFGPENLFVLDHGSEPPAASALPDGVNVLRIPRGPKDEITRSRLITGFVHALLQAYEGAVFADADEIILPDPDRHANLAAYLRDAVTEEAPVAPTGIELIQLPDEAPIDWTRPILGQRQHARFFSRMCKPVVLRSPVTWSPGLHGTSERARYADDLYLFHLKPVDSRASLDRLAATRNLDWAPSNLARNLSHRHRRTDEEHLDEYYAEPARQLAESGPAPWDFRAELDRVQSGLREHNGAWLPGAFYGPPVRIPSRFLGLV